MAKTINATVKVGESVVASNAKIDLLKAAVAALGVVVDELTRDTVIVLVDKNRVKAGAYAIKRFGCDTLVLDDGFQYLPLKGSLNLLFLRKL